MILENIQFNQNVARAVQWDGDNLNEIRDILYKLPCVSFSFSGCTWKISTGYGKNPIELELRDILVFYRIENKTYLQVYSVKDYNQIFVNRPAFE